MLDSPGPRIGFRSTVAGCGTSQPVQSYDMAISLAPYDVIAPSLFPKSLALVEDSSAFDTRRLFAYMTPQGLLDY